MGVADLGMNESRAGCSHWSKRFTCKECERLAHVCVKIIIPLFSNASAPNEALSDSLILHLSPFPHSLLAFAPSTDTPSFRLCL